MSTDAYQSFSEDGFDFNAYRLTCCKDIDREVDATSGDWKILRWGCMRDVSSCLQLIDCRCAEPLVNHEAELSRQVEEAKWLRHEDDQVAELQIENGRSGS